VLKIPLVAKGSRLIIVRQDPNNQREPQKRRIVVVVFSSAAPNGLLTASLSMLVRGSLLISAAFALHSGVTSRPPFQRSAVVRDCICINCKWVDRCTSYHFVETKHEQPHLTPTPDFTPREGSPKVTVAIRREDEEGARIAWDAVDDKNAKKGDAVGSQAAGGTGAAPPPSSDGAPDKDEEYDHARHLEMAALAIPKFTTEYDVVECADFVQDNGRWVRLMPEDIKRLNPDFVPS
jgi:hypothetical protein